MIARELLATAEIPGGGTLRLVRHDRDHMIMLGRAELMSSRGGESEAALARLACAALGDCSASRLLIGGLGLGFTLRAALGLLGPDARVVVAELIPAVIDWARGPLAALHGTSLADARVTIVAGDVAALIAAPGAGYDAILLDVDNGPDGFTTLANDGLYTAAGLAAARRALRPGGVLAIWSAAPDPAFARRLSKAGFRVRDVIVRARDGRHVIWLAVAP